MSHETKSAFRADLQASVRTVCGCGCPVCVKTVYMLSENDLPWPGDKSPCRSRMASLRAEMSEGSS